MDYNLLNLSPTWTTVLIILIAWEVAWKGLALWRASHNDQIDWFVALLIINSVGVLPILYLVFHPKPDRLKTSQPG